MSINHYFNNFNSKAEQRLYEDLIGETIKIWGIDSFYIPRTSDSQIDLIYGEDPTKVFESAYPVEVYVKNVDNFEGQELFSKFGLEIQNQIRFLMPTRAFNQRVPSSFGGRPREGDLLWLTNFQALFELKYVNQQNFFYAFGNQNFYGFELVCERFRYSNERVETGISEIDTAADNNSFVYNFTVQNSGSGTYAYNETVYQGTSLNAATATAKVVSWDVPSVTIQLKDIKGVFTSGQFIVGASSNARYSMNTSNMFADINMPLSNNDEFNSLSSSILDFSEHNPFGEP